MTNPIMEMTWKNIQKVVSTTQILRYLEILFLIESLSSAVCVKISFNCIKNIEKQMKKTMKMVKTQERQVEGELQLKDLKDSIHFVLEKFHDYDKDKKEKEKRVKNIVTGTCANDMSK